MCALDDKFIRQVGTEEFFNSIIDANKRYQILRTDPLFDEVTHFALVHKRNHARIVTVELHPLQFLIERRRLVDVRKAAELCTVVNLDVLPVGKEPEAVLQG